MARELYLSGNIEQEGKELSLSYWGREDVSDDELRQIFDLLAGLERIGEYVQFEVTIKLFKNRV